MLVINEKDTYDCIAGTDKKSTITGSIKKPLAMISN
jgi:hypothetical protein